MNEFVKVSEPRATLSTSEFNSVAKLAHQEFGLSLPASKQQLVQSRLARRVRALSLPDFKSYVQLLHSPQGKDERNQLLSALTTNVTKFFRELHHFEELLNVTMPRLVKRAKSGERIRIWSAGCSSGQEPYSIAMTALKVEPDICKYDFKILATDIDPDIIAKATRAVYSAEEIEGISQDYFRSEDIVADRTNIRDFAPSEAVRNLVTLRTLNLIEPFPFKGEFNLIFCRNVAIYFDKSTQNTLWNRFSKLLPDGGKLFIGHSERIAKEDHPHLKTIGVTMYEKQDARALTTTSEVEL